MPAVLEAAILACSLTRSTQGPEPVLKQPPQQVSFTGAHLRLLRFLIAPDAVPAVSVDFRGLTIAARARRQKYDRSERRGAAAVEQISSTVSRRSSRWSPSPPTHATTSDESWCQISRREVIKLPIHDTLQLPPTARAGRGWGPEAGLMTTAIQPYRSAMIFGSPGNVWLFTRSAASRNACDDESCWGSPAQTRADPVDRGVAPFDQ